MDISKTIIGYKEWYGLMRFLSSFFFYYSDFGFFGHN